MVVDGVGAARKAWEADVLPLNYTRIPRPNYDARAAVGKPRPFGSLGQRDHLRSQDFLGDAAADNQPGIHGKCRMNPPPYA